MTSLFAVLALGFFLGMRHATDADHVVAISTLVSREKTVRMATLLGALWGVGHTLTILLVGGAILLFGVVFPARIGLAMEFSVAIMLIVLGVLNVTGFVRRLHELTHEHASEEPSLETTGGQHWIQRIGSYRAIRSIVVGVIHGLAGSAAVALMVLASIRDVTWAMLYLVLFGIGTVAGMMVITSALAVPMAYTARRFNGFNHHLAWISGLLSVFFGLFLVYEIGFVDGLFGANPHWDPR